jgi:tRNA(fMet)-specific endonuclease VapC
VRTYLLDTNACIDAINGDAKVLNKLLSKSPAAVFVSVITEAELRLGPAKSSSPSKSLRALEHFLEPLTVVEFSSKDAVAYARIRAKLETAGKPIGPLDTLIAAQAVSRGHWLVTDNEKELTRVPGLGVENWTK